MLNREEFDRLMKAWLDEEAEPRPDVVPCVGLPMSIVRQIAKEASPHSQLILSRSQYDELMKEEDANSTRNRL